MFWVTSVSSAPPPSRPSTAASARCAAFGSAARACVRTAPNSRQTSPGLSASALGVASSAIPASSQSPPAPR
jgi:hypothetical protein